MTAVWLFLGIFAWMLGLTVGLLLVAGGRKGEREARGSVVWQVSPESFDAWNKGGSR